MPSLAHRLLSHPRRRRAGALAAALSLAALGLWFVVPPASAAPGEIDGDLPPAGGVALVQWDGGSVDAMAQTAETRGCDLQSVWAFIDGEAAGYILGAPPFANADFTAVFPDADLPAMPLVLRCEEADPGPGISAVALERAFDVMFMHPVDLVPYPGDRFLLAEQGGRVQLLGTTGDPLRTTLDLTDTLRRGGEEGLLSITLDPAFDSDPYLWAYYTPADGERRSRIARFTLDERGVADPASELVVLEVPQPFANHNGGTLRFGPDGMLYLGLGDGGGVGDPLGHAQDPSTLHGSIVRIDVSNARSAEPYAIPGDNPFVGAEGRDEVWAYGLRNPWRMAFDPVTEHLWAADVGQHAVEEVNIIEPGGNHGWNVMEGDQCYDAATCDDTAMTPPVATYSHALGCSVTGGVVSRTDVVPEIADAYLYGDFCSGRIWALDAEDPGDPFEVAHIEGNPVSFSVGADGHVYVLLYGGQVLRIVSP